jgi:PAS domain S-box-containing protein
MSLLSTPVALAASQLFVHTRDAVVVGNVDTGSIALWNPAAERLFGWSAREAIGQPIRILIPPAVLWLHQAGMGLYRRGFRGGVVDSGAPMAVLALTRDGNQIPIDLSLTSLEPESDGNHYVLAVLRDGSDRRRTDLHAVELAQAESARAAA